MNRYAPILLPGTLQARPQQGLAQAVIERITLTYSREEARKDGINYWPDPLPTPQQPSQPDPLVLFLPDHLTPGELVAQRSSVIPMTMLEVLARRSREQLRPSMQIPLGLIDKPDMQQCDPFLIDLHGIAGPLTGGPLLIAGAQHSGKATALQTILLWLMTRFLPEQFRCAIIDPLHELDHFLDLPHLRSSEGKLLWTDGSSDEQLSKFATEISYELVRRREEFSYIRWNESTVTQLWQMGDLIPQFLLVISHYHSFAERHQASTILRKLALTMSEEKALGAYLIVSSAESGSRYLPIELMSKFTTRIGLHLNEQQRFELFGRVALVPEPIPGRGLVMLPDHSVYQVQLALPIAGENEGQRYETLRSRLQLLI